MSENTPVDTEMGMEGMGMDHGGPRDGMFLNFDEIDADKDAGKFPIKMRDVAVKSAVAYLVANGLFPDDSDAEESEEEAMGDVSLFDFYAG